MIFDVSDMFPCSCKVHVDGLYCIYNGMEFVVREYFVDDESALFVYTSNISSIKNYNCLAFERSFSIAPKLFFDEN